MNKEIKEMSEQDLSQLIQLKLNNGQIALDTSQLQKYLIEMKNDFEKQLDEIKKKHEIEINELKNEIELLKSGKQKTKNSNNKNNQNNQNEKKVEKKEKSQSKDSKQTKEIKEKENVSTERYEKKQSSPLDQEVECSICHQMIESDKIFDHMITHNGNDPSEEELFQHNQQPKPLTEYQQQMNQRKSTSKVKKVVSKIATQVNNDESQSFEEINQIIEKKEKKPSTKGRKKKVQTQQNNAIQIDQENSKLHKCIVCGQMFPESEINEHYFEMHVDK